MANLFGLVIGALFVSSVGALFVSSVKSANPLRCLNCDHVADPRLCRHVTTCFDDEKCGMETYISADGNLHYKLGCVHINTCSVASTPVPTGSGLSLFYSCHDCCDQDLCNVRGCNITGYPAVRGPVCFNCEDYPHDYPCHKIQVCETHEVCYNKARLDFETRQVHSSGCISKHNCGSSQLDPMDLVGKRSNHLCSDCCNSDLCNLECHLGLPCKDDPTCPLLMASYDICKNAALAPKLCPISCNMCPGLGTSTVHNVMSQSPQSTSRPTTAPVTHASPTTQQPTQPSTTPTQPPTTPTTTQPRTTPPTTQPRTTPPTTQPPATPTTQPPTTPTPTTTQPRTTPPTTQPPTTPTTTQPPTTPTTTQPPSTPPTTPTTTTHPTTQAPTTHAPTTQRPTTQVPTSQRTTHAPTTQRSTTQAPTTQRTTHTPTTQPTTTPTRPTTPSTTQPTTPPITTQTTTTQTTTTQTTITGKTPTASVISTTPLASSTQKIIICNPALTASIAVGTVVVRGPDWKWGDQDGHALGTVIGHGATPEWIRVRWDNNFTNVYRNGVNNSCDVMPASYHVHTATTSTSEAQAEHQIVWNLMRHRVTRRLIWIQTVCIGTTAYNYGVRVGDLVVRGPDWHYGDQDKNGTGKVIGVGKPIPGYVAVHWIQGNLINVYRLGYGGKYDVKLYQGTPATTTPGTTTGTTKAVPTYGPQLAKMMYVGARVIRGKDWKWDEQDSHGMGDVIEVPPTSPQGWVRVKWDNGTSNVYRMGAEGAYDLMFVPGSYNPHLGK